MGMSQSSSNFASFGAFFFTVCLARRGSDLLVSEIDILRWAVAETRLASPFEVLAWVVLPDHMHAIWRLPEGDTAHARRWTAIKGRFSQAVYAGGLATELRAKIARGELGIWQNRQWSHEVTSMVDMQRFLKLCRWAPVNAKLVRMPEDWEFSSFHRQKTCPASRYGSGMAPVREMTAGQRA
jgi:putative transposase